MPSNTVILDLETRRIARAYGAPKPICAGWFDCDRQDAQVELIDSPLFIKRMFDWLYGSQILGNHHIAFDFSCLLDHFWDLPVDSYVSKDGHPVDTFPGLVFDKYAREQIVDTLISQQLIDVANGDYAFQETNGYDLIWVAQRNGIPVAEKTETWRLYYEQLDGIDPSIWPREAVEYVLTDVRTPAAVLDQHLVWNAEFTARNGSPQLHDVPFQCQAALSLELASNWGVRTDTFRVQRFRQVVETETERLRLRLQSAGLVCPALVPEIVPQFEDNGKPRKRWGHRHPRAGQPNPDARKKNTFAAKARMVSLCAEKKLALVMTEPAKARKSTAPFVPQVCLNADACIRVADPTLIDYAEYTSETRTLSIVEDLAQGLALPLQTRFVTVRDTGRTSSRKPRGALVGMQMQNFARGYPDPADPSGKSTLPGAREALCPRGWTSEELERVRLGQIVYDGEGTLRDDSGKLLPLDGKWAFFWVDFTAAEMHTLAQSCRDLLGFTVLGDMLNAGIDPHAWFGGIAFKGFPAERAWELVQLLDKKEIKGLRQQAKPENFGFPGGMGAEKFQLYAFKSYGILFTLEECKRLRELWLTCLPEMPEMFRYISRLLDSQSPRRRRLGEEATRGLVRLVRGGRWRGGVPFPAACNLQFQGPCSDGAKRALFAATREAYGVQKSALYGCRPWNFVHDEIPMEGLLERVPEAAERLSELAAQEFNVICPDYPTTAEPMSGLQWSKEGKEVRDRFRRLQLWDVKVAA